MRERKLSKAAPIHIWEKGYVLSALCIQPELVKYSVNHPLPCSSVFLQTMERRNWKHADMIRRGMRTGKVGGTLITVFLDVDIHSSLL